jgi:Ca2+-binding RTX toxin-like protein
MGMRGRSGPLARGAWIVQRHSRRCLTSVVAVAALATAGLSGVEPTAAGAEGACSFDRRTLSIVVSDGQEAHVMRSGDELAVLLDEVPLECGATVFDTRRVVITGSAGAEAVHVRQDGGTLEPGYGEEDGIDEIEFAVDLGAGDDQLFIAPFPSLPSTTGATELGHLRTNADADVDVRVFGVEEVTIVGGREADTVAAGQAPYRVVVLGWHGDDDVTTGPLGDLVIGGDGDDVIRTRAGDDIVQGEAGSDRIITGEGDDSIDGGADTTGGIDACRPGGQAGDVVEECETVH